MMNAYKFVGLFVAAFLLASLVGVAHRDASDPGHHRLGKPTDNDKSDIRGILKQHFSSAVNGNGIGIAGNGNYLVTKFHLVKARQLPSADIKDMLQTARDNNQSWEDVKAKIRERIVNAQVLDKGRIEVNGEDYLLKDIVRANDTWSASIFSKPDFEACKAENKTREDCEAATQNVGSISVAFDKVIGANRVFKGSLTFGGTVFPYVALVHGRGGAS